MLRNIKEILGYTLQARDGEIGRCRDFLFDDENWAIRYMVAGTGKWLPGREVLISPISVEKPEWATKRLSVKLDREQIKSAPPLKEHMPVSRHYEKKLSHHYDLPYYWVGTGLWGAHTMPPLLYPDSRGQANAEEEQSSDNITPKDSHLRSVKEVTGYKLEAADGGIGNIEDFIMDDQIWRVRYVVVETGGWLPGRKVLVSPSWVDNIDWAGQRVTVDLKTDEVKNSPEYDPSEPVNQKYELRLYDYYGRPIYKA